MIRVRLCITRPCTAVHFESKHVTVVHHWPPNVVDIKSEIPSIRTAQTEKRKRKLLFSVSLAEPHLKNSFIRVHLKTRALSHRLAFTSPGENDIRTVFTSNSAVRCGSLVVWRETVVLISAFKKSASQIVDSEYEPVADPSTHS